MLSYNMCAFIIFLFSCRIYTNKSRHAGDEKAKKKKKEKKLWQEEAKKRLKPTYIFPYTRFLYIVYFFIFILCRLIIGIEYFLFFFFSPPFFPFLRFGCLCVCFFCALFFVNIFLIWKENIFEKHFFRILFVWNEMRVNQQREREREKNK